MKVVGMEEKYVQKEKEWGQKGAGRWRKGGKKKKKIVKFDLK